MPQIRPATELAEKHMKTVIVPNELREPTKDLVTKIIAHPAFNNTNYNWSLNDFELGKRLGRGKFGRVYQARDKRSGFMVALKTLLKKEIVKGRVERQVSREIEIQSHLKHKNVLQLLCWFHDSFRIYLVLEFAGEGELYKHLKNAPGGRFNEITAAKYIYQVADAVDYCHQNNVIHRDIKPENLLLTVTRDIKLADFGWSVHTLSLNRKTMCGTLDYLPPEMVDGLYYKQSVDFWCIGILCYEFLHGYPPFEGKNQEETYAKIRTRKIKFSDFISSGARNLIDKLIVVKSDQRMSLKDVMVHPWVVENKAKSKSTRS